MAQIDGQRSVDELVGVTGMAPSQLERIVSKLAFDGAVELTEPPLAAAELEEGTTSLADFAAVLGMDPSSFSDAPAAPAPAAEPAPRPRIRKVVRRPAPETVAQAVAAEAEASTVAYDGAHVATEDATLETRAPDEERTLEERAPSSPDLELELDLDTKTIGGDEAAEKDDEAAHAIAERNYRQLYESRWHALPVDQRIAGAKTAHGPDLLALCFDADARVVSAILENMTTGLDHVRLIAFHHRTTTGLEAMSRRQDWLRDALVERRLLRNPMIGEIVLGRVMNPKRLFPTYKVAIDRDIPELTRIKCRGLIRTKWGNATPEERSDLLLRTEGRCLILMTGCTFDAKTTAILCGRPTNSAMFVQCVAKFAASPPALLAHLLKQPFVRKNVTLKKLLLQHPNLPGDVKRSI